jgi:pimeloyl-ACP methyl ester carboxylesterase
VPGIVRALLMRDPIAREKLTLSFTTRLVSDLQPIAERWARLQAERPIRRATVLKQLLAGARFRAPAQLGVPALVVCGGKDVLTDPGCPRRLADHFGASLVVHPEAGHDLSVDAPDWLVEQVAAFASRLGSKAGAAA